MIDRTIGLLNGKRQSIDLERIGQLKELLLYMKAHWVVWGRGAEYGRLP